jgi:hypothetical protein
MMSAFCPFPAATCAIALPYRSRHVDNPLLTLADGPYPTNREVIVRRMRHADTHVDFCVEVAYN